MRIAVLLSVGGLLPCMGSVAGQREERARLRAVRALAGAGVGLLGDVLGQASSRQGHGQFAAAVDMLRWALDTSGLFRSQTADEAAAGLAALDAVFAEERQTLLGAVFRPALVRPWLAAMRGPQQAAWVQGFDAAHTARLGAAVDAWLAHLAQLPNRRVAGVLRGLSTDVLLAARARDCNSAANVLSVVLQRTVQFQLQPARDGRTGSDWAGFRMAMRFLRRLAHTQLSLPVEEQAVERLFGLLAELKAALGRGAEQELWARSAGPLGLGGADMRFLAARAGAFFLGAALAREAVRGALTAVLEVYEGDEEAGAEALALAIGHTAKSFLRGGVSPGEPLAVQFVQRLLGALGVVEGGLVPSIADHVVGLLEHVNACASLQPELAPEALGAVFMGLRFFLGYSGGSGFNDSLQTYLAAPWNSGLTSDDVAEFLDAEVNEHLGVFFAADPDFDFGAFILEAFTSIAQLPPPEFRRQRGALERFLGELQLAGRRGVGWLLRYTAEDPTAAAEASILLRLAEHGMSFLDSTVLCSVVAAARPELLEAGGMAVLSVSGEVSLGGSRTTDETGSGGASDETGSGSASDETGSGGAPDSLDASDSPGATKRVLRGLSDLQALDGDAGLP